MYYTKQNSHQTPPNKTVWLSNNIKPSFLRVWCLNKIETNQNNIIILEKKKCENWVNSTSQGNLTSASGFRICYINDPFNSFLWVGFVEWLSCIKLFHAKEFDLVWKPNIHCDMLDIHVHVFPKVNILAVRGKPTVKKSVIDKNIMPPCFSHML